MNAGIWYYVGMILLILAVLGGVCAIGIFAVKSKRLEALLEEEYGKRESLKG